MRTFPWIAREPGSRSRGSLAVLVETQPMAVGHAIRPCGTALEDVKQLLGHPSIVLTSNTYGHVLEQRQRAVAMGMDAVLGG